MEVATLNQVFNYNSNKINIIGTSETPYFRGNNIAEILEYKDSGKAIREHVRDKNKKNLREIMNILKVSISPPLKGNEGATIYLNESGIYELIFKSKMKEAVKFQDWVFDEVLPSIRKIGKEKYLKQLQEKDQLLIESQESKQLLIESQEIIKIQELALKEKEAAIKLVEEDNKWLQLISKTDAKFRHYETKKEGLYLGAHESDAEMFMYKLGKSVKCESRALDHSVSTTDLNKFNLYKIYNTYVGMQLPAESFIHALLRPLAVNKTRKEHFMVNLGFIDKITKNVLNFIDSCALDINNYLTLIKDHNFNYELVNNILEKEFGKIDKLTDIKKIDKLIELTDVSETNADSKKVLETNINLKNESEHDNGLDTTKFIRKQIGIVTCRICRVQKNISEFNVAFGKRPSSCKICQLKPRTRCPKGYTKCRGCALNKLKSEYIIPNNNDKVYQQCISCRNIQQVKHCTKCDKDVLLSLFIMTSPGNRSKTCNPCRNSSSSTS